MRAATTSAVLGLTVAAVGAPAAQADNTRLNDSVVANVFTVQHQAGCTNDVRINPQLQLAAQRHAVDLVGNRNLNGDSGSDGSTPQGRAAAAGFSGTVAQTVAINPALAISGVEILNQWYYDPASFAVMANCANNQVGVWSESSADRTVVVAVYGQSDRMPAPQGNIPLDHTPDYDGSDEVEFALDWFPWILRGTYPPPAIPPK